MYYVYVEYEARKHCRDGIEVQENMPPPISPLVSSSDDASGYPKIYYDFQTIELFALECRIVLKCAFPHFTLTLYFKCGHGSPCIPNVTLDLML